jgi:hypothetical protein
VNKRTVALQSFCTKSKITRGEFNLKFKFAAVPSSGEKRAELMVKKVLKIEIKELNIFKLKITNDGIKTNNLHKK